MKQLVIYRVYHKESGKSYIGKCSRGNARIKEHFRYYCDPKYEYRAKLLYRAMKKHGVDNFNYEILYEAQTIEELNNKEKEFITLFDSRNPEVGYNIRHGGDGGDTWEGMSPEARIARIKKQNEATAGSYTKERRKKLSDNLKAIRADKNKSAKNAEVCSERMKRLNKDPNFPRYGRKVYCVETGELFDSVNALSRQLNLKSGFVLYRLTLKRGGFNHLGLQYKFKDKG